MTHEEERLWLIDYLKNRNPLYRKLSVPQSEQGQNDMLRILMNVWSLSPLSSQFLEVQNAYLRRESILKGIIDERMLEPCASDPRMYIWQGDITRIRADAIVNAANGSLLGCFYPLHGCIDNAIHSAAGLELRLACSRIMERQDHDEPAGRARITSGYCLPAKYVLHTVGPIVYGELTDEHRSLLRSSYHSCLELAEKNKLRSIVFCCISTGEFMFPAQEAAVIATDTVRSFLDRQSGRYSEIGSCLSGTDPYKGIEKVIFNVFRDRDRIIYESLLGQTGSPE